MEAMRVSAGFFNSAVYLAASCLESLELLVSFVDSDNFTTFQLIILLINSVSVALKTQIDSALEEEFGVEQEECCRVINKKAIKMSCTTIVNMAMISASGQCSICLQEFEEGQNGKLLLECDHLFHPVCIDKWLRNRTSCPLCRSHVPS